MRAALLLMAALGLGACSGETAASAADPTDATDDEIAVTNRCDRELGKRIDAKVAIARERLAHLDTPYAAVLREELDRGRVKTLPMCKMTRVEFVELQKGTDLTALGATPDEQFASLRRADAPGMKSVHAQLYGFQWDNRIYLSTAMSDALMLETIAHETQHVLRKAHERNFEDQRVTCVEEQAAFEAEILVKHDALTDADRAGVKRTVRELYGLDKLRADTCTYR